MVHEFPHMSDISAFPCALLWGERGVRSAADLTRRGRIEFLKAAAGMPSSIEAEPLPVERANDALMRMKIGQLKAAAVLAMAYR
jgi:alcohol dehydrogenase, propanol-preferring